MICGINYINGFLDVTPPIKGTSEAVAKSVFVHFFGSNVFPWIVVVENFIDFKGGITTIYKLLVVICWNVSRYKNREVILERFFIFLNKSDRIILANSQHFLGWVVWAEFSIYICNGSLVDW